MKIELNHDQFDAFLHDDVVPIIEEVANSRMATVEGNFESETKSLPTRSIVVIRCADSKTYRDNMKNNTLLKVVK